jgi:hypothetical protein
VPYLDPLRRNLERLELGRRLWLATLLTILAFAAAALVIDVPAMLDALDRIAR